MNVEPTQAATDDQELAKVLAGNSKQTKNDDATTGLQFEETPLTSDAGTTPPADDSTSSTAAEDDKLASAIDQLAAAAPTVPSTPTDPSSLDGIKKEALSELRPLVDKLTLPAEEKFDIMLLIIRSTDDQSLVGAAHEAAKGIEDETKRAQALLDIVKEIDYFAAQQTAA